MKRGRRKPTLSDIVVGQRMRVAREEAGLSMDNFGDLLDPPVSHQQVAKYEAGTNKVSASALKQISVILGRPMEWFFKIE